MGPWAAAFLMAIAIMAILLLVGSAMFISWVLKRMLE
jgi:hypothetical protein